MVEDRENYIQAGKTQLSDTSIYEHSDSGPIEILGNAINEFVHNINKNQLDNTTKNFLPFKQDAPNPTTSFSHKTT